LGFCSWGAAISTSGSATILPAQANPVFGVSQAAVEIFASNEIAINNDNLDVKR
jgi:hypothetical protein